jgi:hypothetical protein
MLSGPGKRLGPRDAYEKSAGEAGGYFAFDLPDSLRQ